jgi:(p)ppGpp synthase/HD superfamily hydrolase
LKWALEDYAFRYLEPENYLFVARQLENKRIHWQIFTLHFLPDTINMLGPAFDFHRHFGSSNDSF